MPALPATHVHRERLLSQLDAAVAQPITLLCAPTGWGKTSLVASWIRDGRAPGRVAYARFEPNGSAVAWRLMHALSAAGLAVNPRTAAWIDARPGERAVVVLDDLHNVTDPAALGHIERLISRLGNRLAFVLLARAEPPLSLYRWRVRGQLTELRADHLSFSRDEAADLLRRHGIRLSQQSSSALWQVTDGWPAALCVTVGAMAQRAEPERVVSQLVRGEMGLSEEVGLAEYVRREILAQLDPDVRDVMLRTSILETVCPGLVEALTGQQQGARILAQVGRANSLATFHGGAHSWYRYRKLLRFLLRTELRTSMAAELPALHRAAASWYAANGFPSDALTHALSAGDWPGAERLFSQHWPELCGAGPRTMAPRTLPGPPDDVARRPLLALALAICCRDTGNAVAMTAYIRLAERAFGDSAPAPFAEMLAAARLAEALTNGDSERAASAAVRLLARTEETPPDRLSADVNDAARSVAFITIAGTRLVVRDLDTADLALQQGLDLARQSGVGPLHLVAQRQQAYAHLVRGRLSAASSCARHVIDGARDAGIVESRNVSLARLVLAGISLERAMLDDAAFHLEQAIAAVTPHDAVAWSSGAIPLARLHLARGELDEAAEAVAPLRDAQAAELRGGRGISPAVQGALLLLDADLLVAAGQLGKARQLLADPLLTGSMPDRTTLARARLDLLDGHASVAATAARQVALGPVESLVTAVDAAVLLAEALRQLGDLDGAVTQVDRALRLAAADGIRRPFVGHGAWIADLVTAHGGDLATTLAPIRASLAESPPSSTQPLPVLTTAPPPAPQPNGVAAPLPTGLPAPADPAADQIITEPLTERETMVLQYLRSMLSIAEIASMLNVSANTVKTHVRHVYRKLAVSRRRDAVRRARELRLL